MEEPGFRNHEQSRGGIEKSSNEKDAQSCSQHTHRQKRTLKKSQRFLGQTWCLATLTLLGHSYLAPWRIPVFTHALREQLKLL